MICIIDGVEFEIPLNEDIARIIARDVSPEVRVNIANAMWAREELSSEQAEIACIIDP